MRDMSFLERVPNYVPAEQQRQVVVPKTIPFDYVFQFGLAGKAHNKVQDVVEISSEGTFVALSIGYSLAPISYEEWVKRGGIATYEQPSQRLTPINPTIVPFFIFDEGSPYLTGMLISGNPDAVVKVIVSNPQSPHYATPQIAETTPQRAKIGRDGTVIVEFKESIELSAGLLIQVIDVTNNLFSEKLTARKVELTAAGAMKIDMTPFIGPDPATQKLPNVGDKKANIYGYLMSNVELWRAEGSVSAFTNVSKVTLTTDTSFEKTTAKAEITLDSPLCEGTVLLVRVPETTLYSLFTIPYKTLSFSFNEFSSGLKNAVNNFFGQNINPPFPFNTFSSSLLDRGPIKFDPPTLLQKSTASSSGAENIIVASDEVSFLYSLDILGSGRELQNKPIHNLAGLGNPSGDRPFRPFAKPMLFEPRSFLRIQVEELYCPVGTLYMVLHGYKILGTTRQSG